MKAVIPAAGLGTRFLPYTKAQPKEMLPILEKPAIQYVVEEAAESGIRDIVIVTGRGKRSIEDHFDLNPELERYLQRRGKADVLHTLQTLPKGVRISYVRQGEPRGNGHAVLCAEPSIGSDPFAVLFSDDILVDHPPCTASLVEVQARTGVSCIAVQRVLKADVPSYGMVLGEETADSVYRVRSIIEKPSPADVTSDLVTIGRYVFTSSIFRELRDTVPGRNDEIWLTDAIQGLLRTEDVYARVFSGRRFDIGNRLGWIVANLESAWKDPELREAVIKLFAHLEADASPPRAPR